MSWQRGLVDATYRIHLPLITAPALWPIAAFAPSLQKRASLERIRLCTFSQGNLVLSVPRTGTT